MGGEDYYLELCERPVQFEKANPVNCVFFDEANKQVSGLRSEAPRPDAFRHLPCAQGLRSECPVFRAGAETGVQLHGRCQSASWLSDGQPQGLACLCTVLCLLSFLNSSEHLPRNLPG